MILAHFQNMSLVDNKDRGKLQRNQNFQKPKDNTITDHFGKFK